MHSLQILQIPHPVGGLPAETIQKRANSIIDAVISGLTRDGGQGELLENKITIIKPKPETIEVSDTSDTKALRAMNELLYKKMWTDGLP